MKEMLAKKILIADDDLNFAEYAKSHLIDAGYIVDMTNDGGDAINKIVNGKYDLILLDLIMPVKIGTEVLEYLRKNNNNTPAIALDTLYDENNRKKVLSLGAAGYYTKKDLGLDELVEIVKKYFESLKINS
jgi:DNA-binding response OmpR family regulator